MLAVAWRYFFDAETTMKLTRLATLIPFASFAFSVLLPGVSAAAGGLDLWPGCADDGRRRSALFVASG
jgi:hypothetical protein